MSKKKQNRIVQVWKKIDKFTRFIFISILVGAIIFFASVDLGELRTYMSRDEEDYIALEQVVYDILETKNVTQPLSNKLHSYDVEFNNDGTIDMSLYTVHNEYLKVTLTEDYQIRYFARRSDTFFMGCQLAAGYFVCGLLVCGSAEFIFWVGKKVICFIKKPKNEDAGEETDVEESTVEENNSNN